MVTLLPKCKRLSNMLGGCKLLYIPTIENTCQYIIYSQAQYPALTLKGMLAPSSKFCNQQLAEFGLLASNVTALPHVRSSLTLSKRVQHLNFFEDVFSMSDG